MEDISRSLDTPSVLQIEPYLELWAYEACHHRGRDHCPRRVLGLKGDEAETTEIIPADQNPSLAV